MHQYPALPPSDASACPCAPHADLARPLHTPPLLVVQPQQAGTVRKNAYIVIKGRPCKVGASRRCCLAQLGGRLGCCSGRQRLLRQAAATAADVHTSTSCRPSLPPALTPSCPHSLLPPALPAPPQVVDVSTSKTGKHGHAKCAFVAVDIFTGAPRLAACVGWAPTAALNSSPQQQPAPLMWPSSWIT